MIILNEIVAPLPSVLLCLLCKLYLISVEILNNGAKLQTSCDCTKNKEERLDVRR